MSKYQIFYPGVWTEREKPYAEQYMAQIKALEDRGPVDVKALIAGTLPPDTPGIGPKLVVDEKMMDYMAYKYDPENKLYSDDAYARQMGYEGKLAMPAFGAHDDSFLTAFPGASRDFICVCSLDHSVTQLAPVYAGDTLYLVKDFIKLHDVTPEEGGIYRNLVIRCGGTVYNQKGTEVLKVVFGATENLKSWADPKDADPSVRAWESPDWWKRPEHVYTDGDWEKIKAIWRGEKRRGGEVLYWEDVHVGDFPAWTVEGPIESTANPTPPYGMGIGGSRTMKAELLDEEKSKHLRKDEKTGIYYPEDKSWLNPEPPEYDDPRKNMGPPPGAAPGGPPPGGAPGGGPAPEPKRGIFINFAGRDFAIRHINNWMGDHGWLQNIRWGIMTDLSDFGYSFPMAPEAENFVALAPSMQGRRVNAHGLQHDVMLIKSQVFDKYEKDGGHFVELAFWMETIDGYIYEHGRATVKLPSKKS